MLLASRGQGSTVWFTHIDCIAFFAAFICSTMAMMTAGATATRVLKESVWLLHLPSSLPSCHEGGEEGDAIDLCGPDRGVLQTSRHSFYQNSCS